MHFCPTARARRRGNIHKAALLATACHQREKGTKLFLRLKEKNAETTILLSARPAAPHLFVGPSNESNNNNFSVAARYERKETGCLAVEVDVTKTFCLSFTPGASQPVIMNLFAPRLCCSLTSSHGYRLPAQKNQPAGGRGGVQRLIFFPFEAEGLTLACTPCKLIETKLTMRHAMHFKTFLCICGTQPLATRCINASLSLRSLQAKFQPKPNPREHSADLCALNTDTLDCS